MAEFKWPSVCFLAGTLGQGGAEQQLLYILKTIQACGGRLHVLCLTQGEYWEEPIRKLGIPVTWVGRSGNRAIRVMNVAREVRRCRPDVLQSQHFYTNLYSVAAARVLGVTDVGAIRGDLERELRAMGWPLGQISLRLPRFVAANSENATRQAAARGADPRRIRFLPNAVDTDHFRPGRPRQSPMTVLAVGRCVPEKRYDRFLSILARLRQGSQAGVRGIVVGDGPIRAELEENARALGLVPHGIEFAGRVSDVARYYRDADALLLTSDWEGTPNVLLEAMSSGLAVVSSSVGDAPGIVTHGTTGFLFEPSDEEHAVDSLSRLATDPSLRFEVGRRAREYVEENRSLRCLADVLEGFYRDVLS